MTTLTLEDFVALPLTDMSAALAAYRNVPEAPCALCRELERACLVHREGSDWPKKEAP